MSRARQLQAIDITQRPHPVANGRIGTAPTLLQRLRSANTQALIAGSCTSMRDFCTNIQTITSELNTLLNSIENLLPLLNTYLTQPRETITIAQAPAASAAPAASTPATPPPAPKQPRPEDIQQLLENPLVKNLLTNFMQNLNSPKPTP